MNYNNSQIPRSPNIPNYPVPANKTNQTLIFIIIILLLIIVGGGAFVFARYIYSPKPVTGITTQQQVINQPAPSSFSNLDTEKVATVPAAVEETVNWETYSLPEFSIRLPNGWFGSQMNDGKDSWFENYDVKQAQGRDFSQSLDKGKLKIEISLESYTGDLLSFVSERHKEEETRGPKTFNDSVVNINKLKMIKSESGNGITAIYAKHPTKQEVLTILFGLDFDNYKRLLNQILSTFKFN